MNAFIVTSKQSAATHLAETTPAIEGTRGNVDTRISVGGKPHVCTVIRKSTILRMLTQKQKKNVKQEIKQVKLEETKNKFAKVSTESN